MTDDEFSALAKLLQLREGKAREGARLVLVENCSGVEAAARTGASPQSISNTVSRCRAGLDLARRAVGEKSA